jgi:hypothetical protein
MKELYLLLKARLLAINGINHVAMWNNQFENENNENAFLYPCVFIHFSNAVYSDISAGVQGLAMEVVFHVGFEAYEDENLEVFDLKDLIHASIQGFSGGNFDHFNRVLEELDVNHTNIQDYIMTYHVEGSDSVGHVNNKYSLLKTVELELNTTFEIDNDIIRTGIID